MELKSETTRSIRLRNGRNNNHCFTKGLKNGFACTNARKTGRKLMCHRNIQALFVLAILVLNFGAVHTWQHMECKHLNPKTGLGTTSKEMEVKGIPHAPIHINGNGEFTSTNGVTGGSGTENDPYIIEGWDIDANGGSYGIWIENTSVYFVIRNCTVYNATDSGSAPYGASIALNNVTHGTLDSNRCNNSQYGIYLYGSSQYNNLTNNKASGNGDGIYLWGSSNNTIANNNASDNKYGISLLFWCSSNIIINNSASRNSVNGITLTFTSNNSITNNNASHNSANGIRLESSSNNSITNNNASHNEAGLYLGSSSNNTITDNNALHNSAWGILLYSSSSNTITNNNASHNNYGIYLDSSSNNIIINNNASENSNYDIHLESSTNNNITNNTMFFGEGICLLSSCNTNLTGNIMYRCGIIIDGSFISDWNTHEIDTSNKVNGKPVYYYRNQNGGTVPSPAGQVILANCTGMTVENLDVSTASRGIQLGFSSYNTVKNNNASGNAREGIFLVSSHCNTITNNNASGNSYGIYLWYSSNNTITNNNASGNSWDGISLYASSNNNLTYNWICNNAHCGVSITSGSTGNIIHHNNFIGNGATALRYLSQWVSNDTPNGAGKGVNGNSQAYDSVGGNYWYDNTAREGNYWSNWDGQGWGSPDAYPIDGGAGASDWYPLNGPVVPECSKFLLVALLTLYLFGLVAVRKRQK